MTVGTPQASNDTMIRDFLAGWESRHAEYIVSCFTDDAVYHSIPLAPIIGKDSGLRYRIRQGAARALGDSPPNRLWQHRDE